MNINNLDTFCPTNVKDWRRWLTKNHQLKQSVWLIYFKRKATRANITYNDAVDEALCFGWIDSTRYSLDEERFRQFFCRRKPRSGWSKINKARIERLIEDGRMTPAGYAAIEAAKKNGTWKILDEVEKLTIPKDLSSAFKTQPGSRKYFMGLSRSAKKMMLQWVVFAKRPETRAKRISEIVEQAAQGMKPKQFR